MAIALQLKQTDYILEEDRELDKKEQTIFKLKPMSAKQYAVIQDAMKLEGKGEDLKMGNLGSHTLNVLECGLVGWDNLLDIEGNPVKFKTKDVMANIDILPVNYRFELASAIIEQTFLKDKERKN